MRKSSELILAIGLVIPLLGASAPPRVYFGVQALLATGSHTDVAGKQTGLAGGALLQFGVRGSRIGMHAEGIPPVSLPQAPSAYYGQATPQLSLINAAADAAVDRNGYWWLGAGMTVVNQRTPLPNLHQVVTSRLAGARYELVYRKPVGETHFIEGVFGGAPHLSGSDHYTYSDGSPPVDKPEAAAEEDAMLAYGVTRGNTQWLVGVRAINFSARYVFTGEAADRNSGGGPLLEWRQFIR
jgi:hypothetical protein